MHTDILDAHCYVFNHWVLGLLDERPKITSIKFELVPYLVRRQFLGLAGVPESLHEAASHATALANSMSAGADVAGPDDLIRCFSLVLPADGLYCARAKSVPAYARINREVATLPRSEYTPWPKLPEAPGRFRDSLIGTEVVLGSKVSIVKSCVGSHCKIGAGVKLNSCIVMGHVVIGDNSVIQNTIICKDTTIGAGCNINECQIAATSNVAAGSRLKDEQVGKEPAGADDYW
uniref:Mannose-1-phosphate guanyltransferase C-terminal domain-containing protein n=1 Tax=Bicosoecida sp. CB-2014 TaxID=1486930 RepID=A0A7S1G7X8_9STRA|mmetsp:Transcript_20143/g.71238  ORF Transcript_20143/g.71238 Transcript_20143/m.71238 type:complete len:233 (+) Transcript_20143:453-1151(+)